MVDTYRNWGDIEKLPLASQIPIRNLIPKTNVYQDELPVLRSEPLVIPPAQWNEIHDAALPDPYAKSSSVDSYFCVCVYVLRRVGMLSIAAQQSVEKSETIEHTSSLRESISSTERLDAALDGSSFSEAGSVMAHIGASFELTTVSEYATEDRRTSVVDIRYEQSEYDRDVVFWDVAKVVVLYRKMKEGFKEPLVRMAALDDFYFETYQKTYTYEDSDHLMVRNDNVLRIDPSDNNATAGISLRLTGCVTGTIVAQNITHRTNVLQYAHCYDCSHVQQTTGAIRMRQTLHREGTVHAQCPVYSLNNGHGLRIT